MHPSILEAFQDGYVTGEEVFGKRVLEVGSADVNGSVRPIIESYGPASYLGVDQEPGPGVDRVVDAGRLADTFGEGAFDLVISTEMMEHVANWRLVIANMTFVLAEGGLLVITTRSPGFPYHAFPDDYWRYTPDQLRAIFKALKLDVLDVSDDPDPTMPGVLGRARKPAGWDLPDQSALLTPQTQPDRAPTRPLTVLGFPHIPPDGSGYYRYYMPFKELGRMTPHRIMLPQLGTQYVPTEEDLAQLDAISAQRIMGPGLELWKQWHGKVKLVYETDDDIFRPDPATGLAHLFDPAQIKTARECVAMSDLVTVSTEPLAASMRRYNPNVAVVPNCVHGDLLHMERVRRPNVTVGWAGGMSHLADWITASEPVADVLFDSNHVDMHFVGITYAPLLRGFPCRYTPWHHDVWDYLRAIDFDIGLAPLADTPFNRCKSAIKALEYMALGIPVIAANIPPYSEIVVDGETGFLVGNADEWAARLRELIADAELREAMGKRGREVVAAGHTMQTGWRAWRDAYEKVCEWHA